MTTSEEKKVTKEPIIEELEEPKVLIQQDLRYIHQKNLNRMDTMRTHNRRR